MVQIKINFIKRKIIFDENKRERERETVSVAFNEHGMYIESVRGNTHFLKVVKKVFNKRKEKPEICQ